MSYHHRVAHHSIARLKRVSSLTSTAVGAALAALAVAGFSTGALAFDNSFFDEDALPTIEIHLEVLDALNEPAPAAAYTNHSMRGMPFATAPTPAPQGAAPHTDTARKRPHHSKPHAVKKAEPEPKPAPTTKPTPAKKQAEKKAEKLAEKKAEEPTKQEPAVPSASAPAAANVPVVQLPEASPPPPAALPDTPPPPPPAAVEPKIDLPSAVPPKTELPVAPEAMPDLPPPPPPAGMVMPDAPPPPPAALPPAAMPETKPSPAAASADSKKPKTLDALLPKAADDKAVSDLPPEFAAPELSPVDKAEAKKALAPIAELNPINPPPPPPPAAMPELPPLPPTAGAMDITHMPPPPSPAAEFAQALNAPASTEAGKTSKVETTPPAAPSPPDFLPPPPPLPAEKAQPEKVAVEKAVAPSAEAIPSAEDVAKSLKNSISADLAGEKSAAPASIAPEVKASTAAASNDAKNASGDKPALSISFISTETTVPLSVQASLKKAAIAAAAEGKRITVIAYASGTGDQATTARRVSLSRALAVRAFLIEQGVKQLNIAVQAKGSDNPGGEADRADIFIATDKTK